MSGIGQLASRSYGKNGSSISPSFFSHAAVNVHAKTAAVGRPLFVHQLQQLRRHLPWRVGVLMTRTKNPATEQVCFK